LRDINLADIHVLQSMIDRRVRALGANLRASFDPNAVTAVTSENAIIFPSPKLPMTKDQYDLLYGYMIHETGHHTRPEAFNILKGVKLPNNHPLLNLFNLVEDNSMEMSVSKGYLGDRMALSKGMTKHVENNVNLLLADKTLDNTNPEYTKIMAVSKLNIEGRRNFDTMTDVQHVLMDPILTDSSRELYDELIATGFGDRMQEAMDVAGSWNLSCDLYKKLYPDVPEEDVEKVREQGLKAQAGDTKGEGEDTPASVKDNGKEEGEEGEAEGTTTYSWKMWVKSDHDEGGGRPAIIDWEGKKDKHEVLLHKPSDINVVDCDESNGAKRTSAHQNCTGLANAVRIYIQANARTKIKPEQYRGKIDRRNLTRLAYPPLDGGEWNKKIFYTLENRKYKNTCIGLLVDWSGSMIGYPMEIAAATVARLSYVFDTQLHVPVMISAYSTGGHTGLSIGRIKEFHTKETPDAIVSKLHWFRAYTSGNADGDSLMWMYNEMRYRKEERKIIFVMTDGAPTDCTDGANPHDVLKYACRAVEADPNFTLYGIGMNTDQPKRYYKNSMVINDMAQLDAKLLRLMKEVYDNGGR
jgi:cobalamin biosynthesis protein CobT